MIRSQLSWRCPGFLTDLALAASIRCDFPSKQSIEVFSEYVSRNLDLFTTDYIIQTAIYNRWSYIY